MESGCQTLTRSLYLGASAVWHPDTDNNPAATAGNALSLMRMFIAVRSQANEQHQRCEPAAGSARSATVVNGWPASAECCGSASVSWPARIENVSRIPQRRAMPALKENAIG